jgi:cyclase
MDISSAYALKEIKPGVYAYIHETGTWGLNNAGLIVKGDAGLFVDTLFDMQLTGEMRRRMGEALGDDVKIGTIVNTHANGDHWYGNGHFSACEIISTHTASQEMKELPPKLMKAVTGVSRIANKLGPLRSPIGSLLSPLGKGYIGAVFKAAPYLERMLRPFDFGGIEPVYPNRCFSGSLTVALNGHTVELLELGPAHTRGDAVVFDPETRVLFTGDLLFMGAHPLVWAGPFSNWIAACDKMIDLKPEVVVPGHGPLTEVSGIEATKSYLVYMEQEIRKCHKAGLSEEAAVRTLDLGPYAELTEKERIVVNVETLYAELDGSPPRPSIVPCFPKMAAFMDQSK